MSIRVTFHCPACQRTSTARWDGQADALTCTACQERMAVSREATTAAGLGRCLLCPCTELYVRKAFPQRWGLALVVLGFVASCVAWYYARVYLTFGILFGTALADFVLYLVMGHVLVCYRCGSEYRDLASLQRHGAFDLATHERHRQMAARLADARRATVATRPSAVSPTKKVSGTFSRPGV